MLVVSWVLVLSENEVTETMLKFLFMLETLKWRFFELFILK